MQPAASPKSNPVCAPLQSDQAALLLRQLPALLWTLDKDLIFRSSLGRGLEALKLQPNEVVGQSLEEFFRGVDHPAIEIHQRAIQGESAGYESQWAGSDFLVYVEPLRDESSEIVGCIGVALDITPQQQARRELEAARAELEDRVNERTRALGVINAQLEQEVARRREIAAKLAESEARYRGIVESQVDLVIRHDLDGNLTYANDAYLTRTSSSSSPTGRGNIRDHVHREDLPLVDRLLREMRQSPTRVSQERRTLAATADDGLQAFRWHAWEHYGLPDYKGEVTEIQAVGRDTEALHAARDDAQRHLDELAHATRVTTIGELASQLAHELNQPLAAVGGYLSSATRHLTRASDGAPQDLGNELREVADDLRSAEMQTHRAGDVVRRIKDFTRKEPARRGPVVISDVISRATQLLDDVLLAAKIEIIRNDPQPLPPIYADAVQIEQVLVNLIRNAAEACAESPQQNESRRIWFEARELPDRTIAVQVRDNGPGIAPDVRPRLFAPFRTSKPQGSGLGLSISRSIAEAHGGRLECLAQPQSQPGAAFQLTLPICEEAAS